MELGDRIPVNGQDIFNHLVGCFASNHQINCVVEFDGRLDDQVLARAVRETVDIEPVLGCRLVDEPGGLHWERRDDLDRAALFSLMEIGEGSKEMERFITSPLDSFSDPLVQVRLFRSLRDTLCIKVNHDCCDAGGLKEYAQLLLSVYAGQHSADRKKDGFGRSQAGVFSSLNISDPIAAFDQEQINGPSTWAFPFTSLENREPAFVVRHLDQESFETLISHARRNGATVNDILMTSFFRSLFELSHPPVSTPMGMQVTVDLRRYLPGGRADAVCNLSGSMNIYLSRSEDEVFPDTLERVVRETKRMKRGNPGIQTGFFFEVINPLGYPRAREMFQQMRRIQVESGYTNPMLSNLGVISGLDAGIGQPEAVRAYIITPVTMSPNFLLGASTFNNQLTLSAGFYRASVDKSLVESCLDGIQYQLSHLD